MEIQKTIFTQVLEKYSIVLTKEQVLEMLKPHLPEGIPATADIFVLGYEDHGTRAVGRDGGPACSDPVKFTGISFKWENRTHTVT